MTGHKRRWQAGNNFGNRLVDRHWRYACKALKVEGVGLLWGDPAFGGPMAQEAGKIVQEDHTGNTCRIIREL